MTMQLTYHRVNVAACEARQQPIADMIQREQANEVWLVPFSPIDFVNTPEWRHVKREQKVAIPLFRYLVSNDPVDALGYAFQLGIRTIHDLGGRPVRRLHLSLGSPVSQVYDEQTRQIQWMFYLGLGVVLE